VVGYSVSGAQHTKGEPVPEPDAPPEARYANLELDKLVLDSANPRFADAPLRVDDPEPELAHLLRNSNLPDLMRSIGAQGYFPGEPIMVVEQDEGDGYIVIEGNRRVAACLLLAYPDRAPADMWRTAANAASAAKHHPTQIPALIFGRESDIHRYLGYRHISGVQEWSPLAKALYLRRQFSEVNDGNKTEQERLEIVADRIGSTPTYAARLMTSLALYERAQTLDFFGLDLRPKDLSFSLITVAITRRPINQYLNLRSSKDYSLDGLRDDALKNLFDWMFVRIDRKTVLGDSRNVGLLADVLSYGGDAGADVLSATRDLDSTWRLVRPDVNEVVELVSAAIETVEEVGAILEQDARTLSAEEIALVGQLIAGAQALITRPAPATPKA
jgi:hypothetical protein